LDSGFANFGFGGAFFGWQPKFRIAGAAGKFSRNFARTPVFN
jgi:hypothetical protein